MAKVRFLQPYDGFEPGAVANVPGGAASALVLRRVAELVPAPVPTHIIVLPRPQAVIVNVFEGETDDDDELVDRYEIVSKFIEIPVGTTVVKTETHSLTVPAGTEIDVLNIDLLPNIAESVAAELKEFDVQAFAKEQGQVLLDQCDFDNVSVKAQTFDKIAAGEDSRFSLFDNEGELALIPKAELDQLRAAAEKTPEVAVEPTPEPTPDPTPTESPAAQPKRPKAPKAK